MLPTIIFVALILGAAVLFCIAVYRTEISRGVPADLAEAYTVLLLAGVTAACGCLAVVMYLTASIMTVIIR